MLYCIDRPPPKLLETNRVRDIGKKKVIYVPEQTKQIHRIQNIKFKNVTLIVE